MRPIDADALLAEYDAQHEGPPGRARALIENAPTVNGWISVKDRLPETRHAVLVYTHHYKNIWAASMHEDGNWYTWSPRDGVYLDPDWHGPIAYWMPLPESPEET